MKALITQSEQIGPFSTIERIEAGWLAGDCVYPDGVIGDATVGEWVPPPPSAAQVNAPTLAQIAEIEATVTPRRIREAVTTTAGKTWLADADSQIAALRKQLAK